jgi:deoxyribose-phosphate aldolase
MNKDSSLEHLARIVSEEIQRSLTHNADARSGGSCPWCAQSCGGHCSAEVNRIVEVGANRVSALAPDASIDRSIAALIDHTLLKADATYEDIRKICDEAKRYGFASVCINPSMAALAGRLLKDSPVRVCTVVGFPLGATLGEVKAFEAEAGIVNGAHEIDMVLNIGALKSKDLVTVGQDIQLVVQVCHAREAICKVIIETAYLTDEEKISACSVAKASGADFVKTSTGFGPGGASAKDVALMRSVVGDDVGVKASGGIRDWKVLQEMVQSGATRIGASASVKILQEAKSQTSVSNLPVPVGEGRTGNDYY